MNSASIFNGIFYNFNKLDNKQLNCPFSGEKSYSQVRCGLMQEARTKGNWFINATKNDDPKDKKPIKQKPKGNIIYRTLFQYALIEYFEQYKAELENPDINYNNLRRLFARKLDDIYDIKDDFEWWTP